MPRPMVDSNSGTVIEAPVGGLTLESTALNLSITRDVGVDGPSHLSYFLFMASAARSLMGLNTLCHLPNFWHSRLIWRVFVSRSSGPHWAK
eukprot:6050206-Pyramimonas_sp.AAC.1